MLFKPGYGTITLQVFSEPEAYFISSHRIFCSLKLLLLPKLTELQILETVQCCSVDSGALSQIVCSLNRQNASVTIMLPPEQSVNHTLPCRFQQAVTDISVTACSVPCE